jgi:GxxExxY protein
VFSNRSLFVWLSVFICVICGSSSSLIKRGVVMGDPFIHSEVTEAIIGAAMTVLNALKPGLDEKLYERALKIELQARGHRIESQSQYTVYYKGQEIGTLVPDLIVDDAVVVDTKVVSGFNDTHVAQMLGYLNITGLRLALLLNFKNVRLQWRRVVH